MVEIIVTFAGLILGAWKNHQDQKLKYDQAKWNAALKYNAQLDSDVQDARKHTSKELQLTKRILAITGMLSTFVAPVIWMFVYPDKMINVPVDDVTGGIMAWFSGEKEVVKYVTLNGFTFIKWQAVAMLGILGYYFGSGGTRK